MDTGRVSAFFSAGRRDGQAVKSFSKLRFVKTKMFFSFVDLFTLA